MERFKRRTVHNVQLICTLIEAFIALIFTFAIFILGPDPEYHSFVSRSTPSILFNVAALFLMGYICPLIMPPDFDYKIKMFDNGFKILFLNGEEKSFEGTIVCSLDDKTMSLKDLYSESVENLGYSEKVIEKLKEYSNLIIRDS